ncbi:MAG: type I-E CRISPR-associated protein Cas6/Cse3/CasE, partial [Anaerolineae bacterium]
MYLSRLLLNPRNRQVQRETADPYNLHRTLMQAFGPNREQAGVLHRLDTNPRTGGILLLVQSQTAPNWQPLAQKAYLLPADPFSGLENPAVKPVNLALQVGQILRFRLVANKRQGNLVVIN